MKYLKILIILFIAYGSAAQQQISQRDIKAEADGLIGNYQFEKALIVLRNAPDSSEVGVLHRKGMCYSRLGNYPAAIREFEAILQKDSVNRSALHNLGQLYAKNNQHINAKECFYKLIQSDSSNSYYFKQYASFAEQTQDIGAAIVYYAHTIRLNPKDIEAYSAVSNLLLDLEQYATADSLLRQGLDRTNHPHLRLLLAKAQFGAEKYQDVISLVNQLVVAGDTTITYARLLGISYFQLDQYDKVIPCMDFLIRKDVLNDWVYYYKGVSLQQTGKAREAIGNLNKAIDQSISDNISTYYTQLASAFEEVGDIKSAIKHYKAAYESSKSDILLYHLARNYDVYYKDKSQAITYYKRYLSSDDTIKIAKEYSKLRLDQLSTYR